jgi:hypothetical protein
MVGIVANDELERTLNETVVRGFKALFPKFG